jgi:hypothetical protein
VSWTVETENAEVEMAVETRSPEAFLERAIADLAACQGGVMVSIGHKLGLYQALAGQGPLSSFEVAARTGCEERYVREWLNSQVAGGYLAYHDESETYELPAEHVPVLADEHSPTFLPPALEVTASMWFDQERTLEAFRSGEGSPGATTTTGSTAASAPSTGTPTAPPSCRSGCPPSTASSRSSSAARSWRTSAAATGTRRR